jgi:hypothetical protein
MFTETKYLPSHEHASPNFANNQPSQFPMTYGQASAPVNMALV